jgi:CHAT domain-containing protein/Flp pilus assembly protein TadD
MKLYVRLLTLGFCLAFLVYVLEAQDRPAGQAEEPTEELATVEARRQALATFLNSARKLRQANEFVKAAQLLNQAGYLQLRLYLPDKALLTFQQNLKVAEQSNDPAVKVDALNGIGAAYLHTGDYKNATPAIEQALALEKQNNYVAGRAEALLLLSEAQNYTDHALALRTAAGALALWQSIGNTRGIIRSHLSIGTYHLAQNSLEESTRNNEMALNLSRSSGFKVLEAEALINLGFVEYRKGAWHNVLKYLSDAGELIDAKAEPFKMTQISTSIAEAYIESGLPETGLPKYYEALEYIRAAKRPRDELVVRWGIGKAQYLLQKYDDALATLQQTLVDAELQKQPIVIALCHELLGRTYDAMGDRAAALTHLETAFDLYSKSANTMEAARARAWMGQVYENSGRLDEAATAYQEALQTFDGLSDRVNQSATLFALGRLEMKSGNYDRAENFLRKSIDATENMRRQSTSRDLTAGFSATVHDRYEQYIQCLMLSSAGPWAASQVTLAFETSESARGRSLAELLRVSETNLLSNLDPELSKQEMSLRQLLRIKEDERVSLLARKSDEDQKAQLDKLDAELERLNTEYKNVLASINARYPAYGQITQPHAWDLRRIQEEVIRDDDTVLLEYFLGSERSFVWAITRNGFTSHGLPSREAISNKVQSLYNLLKEPAKPENQNKWEQTARELAEMILFPVAEELNRKQILVAADDALYYIPFQVLPTGPHNPEPLVAQHNIINVPSASILGELRKEAGQRGVRAKALAVFGNPIFAPQRSEQGAATPKSADELKHAERNIELDRDTGDFATFDRLFYSEREMGNLRDVATEAQTFAASDYDATREQLLKMDLSQYAILHFATHGLLNPEHPEKSGLLLSTINREGKTVNGFVGLQDIYSLRAPVDLVVLSACQTGLGKNIRGEGLVGLTRGFMYAGATSVVASLWKVEDEATAELMRLFYSEMLKNGKTPAEALRAAQNGIRQRREWSAPHYWAGFTLQGEYRYVVNSSPGWRRYVPYILGATLLLLLLFGVAYRHLANR